jgi:hypothetical protein
MDPLDAFALKVIRDAGGAIPPQQRDPLPAKIGLSPDELNLSFENLEKLGMAAVAGVTLSLTPLRP